MSARYVGSGNVNPAPEWVDCCWPQCIELAEGGGPPLCPKHLQRAGVYWMRTEGPGMQPDLGLLRRRADPDGITAEQHLRARADAMAAQSQVYYVRIGDHIKIGYSINMRQRLGALRVDDDALLATEPGGRSLEAVRHRQFAEERVGKRENFNPSRRLLAHIDAVRADHGEPRITDYKVRRAEKSA